MKKSQLNAISYSYSQKRKAEEKALAEKLNILVLFNYQDTFKSLKGLINAYNTKSKKFDIAKKQGIDKITAKIKSVEKINKELTEKLTMHKNFLETL